MVARREEPLHAARARVEGVQAAVERSDVQSPVATEGGRGDDEPERREAPDLLSMRVERVDAAVERSPVRGPVGLERRDGPDRVARDEAPSNLPVGLERVGGAVGIARVDRPAEPDLGVALPPVDDLPCRRDLRRAVGPDDPPLARQAAAVGSDVVEPLVGGAERDRARPQPAVEGAEDTGGVDLVARLELPAQLAVRPDGVEPAVRRADVDVAVAADDRRAEDAPAGLESPGAVAAVGRPDRARAGVPPVAPHLGPRRAGLDRHLVVVVRSGTAGERARRRPGDEDDRSGGERPSGSRRGPAAPLHAGLMLGGRTPG